MSSTSELVKTVWSQPKKIVFRFFFTYFLLFIFTQNNGAYPEFSKVSDLYEGALYKLIPWIGKNILGITYNIRTGPNGSGDTTYDYVLLFTIFSVSIIAAFIWSLLDRKSKNYKTLYYWLTVAIRFYVGLMLIDYGAAKLFKTQFSYPDLGRLTQTYGESSPMGLAWTFLGFSYGYNIFMGVAEVAAGFLLFRKTLTFGLIITLATAANVMAVNYFYDVPVKITSTHLVLMTLFLMAFNFKSLITYFFGKEKVKLQKIERPKFKNSIVPKILNTVKFVIICLSLYGIYNYTFNMYPEWNKKPALYGFFEVNKFTLNNNELTHFRDSIRWKSFRIGKYSALIKKMNGKRMYFKHDTDTLKSQIVLTKYRDTTQKYILHYTKDSTKYNFNVIMDKDTISAETSLKLEDDYPLIKRGFHLINEYPNNYR